MSEQKHNVLSVKENQIFSRKICVLTIIVCTIATEIEKVTNLLKDILQKEKIETAGYTEP